MFGPRWGWGKGRESPRLACWPGVLVHQFWRILNGPVQRGEGPRPAHVSGTGDPSEWAELQVSTAPYGKTRLCKTELQNPCTSRYAAGGLIREGCKQMCGRKDH